MKNKRTIYIQTFIYKLNDYKYFSKTKFAHPTSNKNGVIK